MKSKGEREEGCHNVKPSHACKQKKEGKDRESLVALLVLTIEFRREERRETTFVPWNGSLSKISLTPEVTDKKLKKSGCKS